MAPTEAAAAARAEGLLPRAEAAEPGAASLGSPGRNACTCVCACLLNLATLLVLVVLLPLLLCVVGLLCLAPLLDRLMHPRRDYLDNVSGWQINCLENAVIHGIIISKERIEAAKLFGRFTATYLETGRPEYARWKERVVRRSWLWPYWEDAAASFEAAYHFRSVEEPTSKAQLEVLVSRMEADPSEALDLDRPPWQVRHYENFTDERGSPCSATVFRVHHSMCDGFTGLRLLMQAAQPNRPPEGAAHRQRERGARLGCCRLLGSLLASIRKLLLMRADPPSVFKAAAGGPQAPPTNVAWNCLRSASVQDLKAVGRAQGGATVNDVLLAALTGALRKYALRQRQAAEATAAVPDLTTVAWVSRSPLSHVYADFAEVPLRWGNSTLGMFYLALPVSDARGSRAVLQDLVRRTRDPALMVEAPTATHLSGFFGFLPRAVGGRIWPAVGNKVSASMSNVPGPQFPIDWCGVPMRAWVFLVPPAGTVSLMFTIGTYNGEVVVGGGADSTVVSKDALQQITGEFFEDEIREMQNPL